MKRVGLVGLVLMLSLSLVACGEKKESSGSPDGTIKLGLITPLSGSAATFGPATVNSSKLAVQEINEAGGLLGKKLELIVGDSATDPKTANEQAKTILEKNKADVLFMPELSSNREAIIPVAEKSGKLFFYNTTYEGGAWKDNMFVNGEVPQQQINPVIPYLAQNYNAKKWYIVGNDYVWSRELSKALKSSLKENGAEAIGEEYVPFGTSEFSTVLAKIQSAQPDFISLELVGSDGISFVKQLHAMGLDKKVKVFAFAVEETAVKAMGEGAVGMLTAVSYFRDLETGANQKFKDKYKSVFGADAPQPTFMNIGSYDAIHLWAKAVKEANSLEVNAVKEKLPNVSFEGPRGKESFDKDSHHAAFPIYLTEVQGNLDFKKVKDFGVVSAGKQK